MPIYHVQGSYSTSADSVEHAAEMFFVAAEQPGSMVVEVFDDRAGDCLGEFDGDPLIAIAERARGITGMVCPETGESYSVAHWKLAAIRARINGCWDHPALLHYGPMTANTNADIMVILNT